MGRRGESRSRHAGGGQLREGGVRVDLHIPSHSMTRPGSQSDSEACRELVSPPGLLHTCRSPPPGPLYRSSAHDLGCFSTPSLSSLSRTMRHVLQRLRSFRHITSHFYRTLSLFVTHMLRLLQTSASLFCIPAFFCVGVSAFAFKFSKHNFPLLLFSFF